MKLSTNFNLSEFRSKDGASFPPEVIKQLTSLAQNLQVIRDVVGPLTILSGYRSPEHNKKVGGANESFHVKGMAADLRSSKYTPKQLRDIIKQLMDEGKIQKGGLKAYATFTHYDIRGVYRTW